MARFNDHTDTFGADLFLDGSRDLAGQPLLNLQAAGEHIHKPGDFAESDDALVGKIGDVALPKEGQQVVLAKTKKLDVLDHHHFVVRDGEGRPIENFLRVLQVPAGQELQGFFVTLRRLAQPFAIRVFPDQLYDFADVAGNPGSIQFV